MASRARRGGQTSHAPAVRTSASAGTCDGDTTSRVSSAMTVLPRLDGVLRRLLGIIMLPAKINHVCLLTRLVFLTAVNFCVRVPVVLFLTVGSSPSSLEWHRCFNLGRG